MAPTTQGRTALSGSRIGCEQLKKPNLEPEVVQLLGLVRLRARIYAASAARAALPVCVCGQVEVGPKQVLSPADGAQLRTRASADRTTPRRPLVERF